jgi:hypothetical protein
MQKYLEITVQLTATRDTLKRELMQALGGK